MPALFFLEKCNSTNEQIFDFITPENREPIALYTFNQTNGKGQYGNLWECAANLNLAFSIAQQDSAFSSPHTIRNFCTAVALADFLAIMTKSPVQIKWPNDIIIRNKKVAGILSEKRNVNGTTFFVTGIGLNILQEDFSQLPKAGSLLTQTGLEFNPREIAETLSEHLSLKNNDCDSDEILAKFNEKLYRKNQVSVFEKNGVRQNGIIKYADADGFLWIDLEDEGLQKFFHKEIELLY